MNLNHLLEQVVNLHASDLHMTVGLPPMARIHGEIVPLAEDVLDKQILRGFVDATIPKNHLAAYENKGEADYSYSIEHLGRFRVNAFHQKGNPALVMRSIPVDIPALATLGVPKELEEITNTPRGLFLVVGPTGSGKSTTLASMLDIINTNKACHIVTVEDPIEYMHNHKKSIVNQREVGNDTEAFATALRSVLRQDPDVILVGEMRDLETMATAITAAETGHMVFATLHTNSAAQTVDRIIDVFPPHQQPQIRAQLAAVLQGILVQQLLPHKDGQRRVVATEYMYINPAARNLIREGKTHQLNSVIQTGSRQGMHTMDMSLKRLVAEGALSVEVALQKAGDRESLQRMLGV
jgi:twitching motility protein PilT